MSKIVNEINDWFTQGQKKLWKRKINNTSIENVLQTLVISKHILDNKNNNYLLSERGKRAFNIIKRCVEIKQITYK